MALTGSNLATDLTLSEKDLTFSDCSSVDDIVPIVVDWQGGAITEKEFSDGIIQVPSDMSNVNRYIAYMETNQHCKMVLFEIKRDSATNVCSYQVLLAKYTDGSCGGISYCTFLQGNCSG